MTAIYINSLLLYSKTILKDDNDYNNITNIKEKNEYLLSKYNINVKDKINNRNQTILLNKSNNNKKRKWYNLNIFLNFYVNLIIF